MSVCGICGHEDRRDSTIAEHLLEAHHQLTGLQGGDWTNEGALVEAEQWLREQDSQRARAAWITVRTALRDLRRGRV